MFSNSASIVPRPRLDGWGKIGRQPGDDFVEIATELPIFPSDSAVHFDDISVPEEPAGEASGTPELD